MVSMMMQEITGYYTRFSECMISEIEYYIFFDLNELGHEYNTDEIWELTRRGIPSPYYSKIKYGSICDYPSLELNEKEIRFCSGNVSVRHYRDCCENRDKRSNELADERAGKEPFRI